MTKVLVVDDSKMDRLLVQALLEGDTDLDVECVSCGADALKSVERTLPGVVVTDLVMPEMDGLEVVAALRECHPGLPVILMTSRGSEEIAVSALKAGAASYVPKRVLREHLLETIQDVASLSRERHAQRDFFKTLRRSEYEFSLASELRLVQPLVRHLQAATLRMGVCDETESNQVAMALHEALQNAAEHGNLEINSELREDDLVAYFNLISERAAIPPYSERRVHVEAQLNRDEARFVVRDEGPGFDPASLPDARDPANLEKLSGRGVLLMRTFMDDVLYNDRGNEVTLVKRRD